MGIHPDVIVLRCNEPLEESILRKIAMFCNVRPDCVIENRTLPILYEAPLMLEQQNLSGIVCRELGINAPTPDLTEWSEMVERIRAPKQRVTVGLVGKYMQLHAKRPALSTGTTPYPVGTTYVWESPQEMILAGDTGMTNPPKMQQNYEMNDNNSGSAARGIPHFRHLGKCNILYADGHVKGIQPDELKDTVKPHSGWTWLNRYNAPQGRNP